jgi:hypothetical protein
MLLEYETGEIAQGQAYLGQFLEIMGRRIDLFSTGTTSMAIASVARITGVTARLDIAQTAAEAVIQDSSATPNLVKYAKAGLALLAVLNSDQTAAAEHHSYFQGRGGTMLWTAISVDRLPGLLAQTMGAYENA